jgi:ferritin-like metal-binding protein YciE
MNDLQEVFLDELADVYHAEKQLLKALPKMARAANSEELREAFESHLEETENQVRRLEDVFEAFDRPAKGKPCKAMMGLIEEGQEIISEHKGSAALDAALICAAQKVEHYEIASYGCLCTWAKLLRNQEALRLLKETLNEEERTDELLSGLAESSINNRAAEEEEEAPSRLRTPVQRGRRNQPVKVSTK